MPTGGVVIIGSLLDDRQVSSPVQKSRQPTEAERHKQGEYVQTQEEAKKIVEWAASPSGKLHREHPTWTREACEAVGMGQLFIGMTAEQAHVSRGWPKDVNRTTTAMGVTEQWCYGEDCKPALYFDNGILTAVQN